MRQCFEGITRNSVEMEFHPFQRMKRAVATEKGEGMAANSDGPISRTSGRRTVPEREETRNLGRARAPKFVQFVLVAALMEWYLQTRTNSPINYKTISPPAGAQSAYRVLQDAERRHPCRLRRRRPTSSVPELLITRISPCNPGEDRGHLPSSPASRRQTPQIFDTQNPRKGRQTCDP
ncbi:hypothetical protein X777_03536 [Ooceraea biroi]|uniref:Uncharacterized protein n=1 Tax=Ooceraea biroi TaxID=2015173 RepID=A0A026WM70_OOCBI|nr:hypothetical protein X777_03536 [Ooceraea biroi]